jgi:UDP-3-O-[3-hydroxymyristoyl] glucosamine N-acyltransferase
MRLLHILQDHWTLVRDGEFQALGLCDAEPGFPILTFAGNIKYLKRALRNPDVSCILISTELLDTEEVKSSNRGICAVPDLRIAFFSLHNRLAAEGKWDAYLRSSFPTRIGKGCSISSLCEIAEKNVVIGDGVIIESFVSIKENTTIGDHCIIRSGSILGGDGLEFIRNGKEGILPVTHCGKLIIGRDVEIQYNCNVSKSLFPWHATIIGDECKIESLVHIAHGVHMGKRNLVAASACIAGSAILGDDVWVGPNATISSEVSVGDRARISLGSVVIGSVRPDQTVTGNFAVDHEKFMQDLMKRML